MVGGGETSGGRLVNTSVTSAASSKDAKTRAASDLVVDGSCNSAARLHTRVSSKNSKVMKINDGTGFYGYNRDGNDIARKVLPYLDQNVTWAANIVTKNELVWDADFVVT